MSVQPSPGDDLADTVARVIAQRRSTRRFAKTPIPKDVLLRLVEAGIQAPSGSNWQNQRFLILDRRDEIEMLGRSRFVWPYRSGGRSSTRENHPSGIVGGSVAVIAVFADAVRSDQQGRGEYFVWESLEIQNCAASIQNILLLATAMGLGSCWVSAAEPMNYTRLLTGKTWRDVFSGYDLPLHFKIQGLILLGYPQSVGADGFPSGERMHGAVDWRSTERGPIERYLVARRASGTPVGTSLGITARIMLGAWSRLVRLLLALVRRIDQRIARIEASRGTHGSEVG